MNAVAYRMVPQWLDRARCRGMDSDLFFPLEQKDSGPAKRVCKGCPVRSDCLQYALTARIEEGVWGGLSPAERRTYKRGPRNR